MQYSFGRAFWYARFVLRLLGSSSRFLLIIIKKSNLSSRIILYFCCRKTCASVVATDKIAEGNIFPPRSSTISKPELNEVYLNTDIPPRRINSTTTDPIISFRCRFKSIFIIICSFYNQTFLLYLANKDNK